MDNIECLDGNTQEEIRVFIHGPCWTNHMPLSANALLVIIPQLMRAGWTMSADERLGRIDIICPSFDEDEP